MKGTVRVHVGGAGSGVKVSMFIYQAMVSGMTNAEYTNSEGDAYIDLDTDQFAQGICRWSAKIEQGKHPGNLLPLTPI